MKAIPLFVEVLKTVKKKGGEVQLHSRRNREFALKFDVLVGVEFGS